MVLITATKKLCFALTLDTILLRLAKVYDSRQSMIQHGRHVPLANGLVIGLGVVTSTTELQLERMYKN